MFDARLFLGLEVTPNIENLLKDADIQLVKAFINSDEAYLHDMTNAGIRYIGKFAGDRTDIASLEQLEVNIKTLMAKIFPEENLSEITLNLFPLIEAHRNASK